MRYFNYHAKIKKLIGEGKLTGFKFSENHNGIKPALILFFDGEKPMPVRLHRFDEYLEIINRLQIKEIKD